MQLASMAGGDVLYIRGGTYSQIFDIYGPSGSANYPTMVAAYPGETPIFNAQQYLPARLIHWMG